MANAVQNSSAGAEATPLYTSRIFTGWYTNRSPLRDGVTTHAAEKAGYGRQDSILDGRNMEITPRLTLGRRAGTSAWGAANAYKRINRFYSFNTFTLTNEVIRVMVDEGLGGGAVYDAFDGSQKNLIFTKSAGADKTYFLGVGNTLYMTNGVDNKQIGFNPTTGVWGPIYDWGIVAPTDKPTTTLPDSTISGIISGSWAANTVYSRNDFYIRICIVDPNGNVQNAITQGLTGASEPTWDTRPFYSTIDGAITWQNYGNGVWTASHAYSGNDLVYRTASDGNSYVFQVIANGTSASEEPAWPATINATIVDGAVTWINIGRVMHRTDIGNSTRLSPVNTITDASGNVQTCIQAGKSGGTPPLFGSVKNAITQDPGATPQGAILWQTTGVMLPVYYGYAYANPTANDISGMSPRSDVVKTSDGQAIYVQGIGSGQPGAGKVIIYRTLHGGSTFFQLTEIDNPGAGVQWTFLDTVLDANLNIFIQAQINGEGTPLPAGATCLAYHLGRIWAAVGNVVWASAGPDAIASTSSGNAGFAISFTCQSKITRLWATSIGLIVFTVRDAYWIQGNGIDVAFGGTGFFIKVWIENLPLLSYDAFTVFGTTAFLYTGKNMVISLDPGAGIVEVSQPIADVLENLDPAKAYLTYHSHNSRDTALYLGNGQDTWYRLNPSIAPESGFAWSLPATPVMGMSALQSVEVTPGVYELLMGPKVDGGKIFKRNTSLRTDDGAAYPAYSDFGVITLASPGQIAGIGWMNLEAWNTQNEPKLSMLMGELQVTANAPLDPVKRTRHDPPNLPESLTLDSTRYSFLRGGSPIWCRHLIFRADFGTAASFDELLSFTIYGSLYQEFAA